MKKISVFILAALLILGLGTQAFASAIEDETPAYTDQENVTVNVNFRLIGAGTSPAADFTLQQIGSGTVTDGDETTAPQLGQITGAVFAEGEATSTGTKKEITIALPAYTAVGVYEYILRQVAGTEAGVKYFDNDIKLVVTVINDDATGKLRIAAVHTEVEGEAKSDTIENTYSAGTLKITKTVNGILGDKSKYFEFTVTLTSEDGKTYSSNCAVSGGSYESNPTTVAIGTSATLFLKDGETIAIANLPYGVTYSVVEKDYSAEEYETEKTGDEGTISSAEQTAAFTNSKGGTPDTGVLLDSLPYIIILGVVVLAGIAMLIKRRKSER